MIKLSVFALGANREAVARIGTPGYLAAFAWLLAIAMATPAERLLWVAAACLGLSLLVFHRPARPRAATGVNDALPPRLQRDGLGGRAGRLILFFLLMTLPPIFMLGETDRALFGLRYSSEGLWIAGTIALRMVIVFGAVQGLTSTVDPTALAGVLERVGLRGMGFALGVALNMLPCLQETSLNMWQALLMRGGLRRQWLQGLRLLTVSVLCQALARAEEIAIAAEARAFSPDRSRPLPVSAGQLDRAVALGGALLLAVAVVPWFGR